MNIRRAVCSDLAPIEALLDAASLPLEGVRLQFPIAYWVAEADAVVGCAGLERHGEFALLRSVVVSEQHRGKSLGQALTRAALDEAQKACVRAVYLLTTTGAEFFVRCGFTTVARDDVPPIVRSAPEFAHICPASAGCLLWQSRG